MEAPSAPRPGWSPEAGRNAPGSDPPGPSAGTGGPPGALVRSLIDGPSLVTALEWHGSVPSTSTLAAEAALRGTSEGLVVAADEQTEGRGRLGRRWEAPRGTSLMCSVLLRPPEHVRTDLVPLMAGLALVSVAAPHCPGSQVMSKWPNDLLIGGHKAAGVLVDAPSPGVVIVGIGINVDWRGIERQPEFADATSLSEAAGVAVDRWRVLAGLAGVLTRRYRQLRDDPPGLLDDYRASCTTLGAVVRVDVLGGPAVVGTAVGIDASGALLVEGEAGRVAVHAGDVAHLRRSATAPGTPAGSPSSSSC